MTADEQALSTLVLDDWRDLQLAMATESSLQTSIRHADTKVIALLTVGGAVVVTAAERAAPLIHANAGALFGIAVALAAVMLVGLVAATVQLLMAMRPRLDAPSETNRFGFAGIMRSASPPLRASIAHQRDEAWAFVKALAGIAMAKHRQVRRSLPWLLVSMASATALMIMETVATAMAG